MATVSAVIDRTANDLGMLRLGQSLQAQDSTRITSAYDEIYAQLKTEGLATWASDGVIPDEVVRYVVALMADSCLGTYGVSNDRYKRIKMDAQGAAREIRKFVTPPHVSQDDPKDY